MRFKRGILLIALSVVSFFAMAQSSLVGREYHNSNIMAGEMEGIIKEANVEIAQTKKEAIAKQEKELGRKLTAKELAVIDDALNKKTKELLDSMRNGIIMGLTVVFKSDTELVMKVKMKIDEAVMKAMGMNWLKRKTMKAAMALGPTSETVTYIRKGNLIFVDDGQEKDTMRLSDDGKKLSGKTDNTKFTLTRIK